MTNQDIKTIIEEVLSRMQIAVESVEPVEENDGIRFCVRTPDSRLLIGARGAHLFALNHVLKKIVGRREDAPAFAVDVNDYQEAARDNLKTLAKVMGERARSFKASVELEPMSSYERMIIHSFFEGAADLKTESVGQGEQRRVVITYVETSISP